MKKTTENTLPKRKSPRASWIDYNEGEYFITVCTQDKIHYFGEIVNDVMCFTPIGAFLDTQLKEVKVHHPHVEILTNTVMPNHFHAIVRIGSFNGMDNKGNLDNSDTASRVPTGMDRLNYRVGERNAISGQRNVPLLSTFVGSLYLFNSASYKTPTISPAAIEISISRFRFSLPLSTRKLSR